MCDTCPACNLPTDDCECCWGCRECGSELSQWQVEAGHTCCESCQAEDVAIEWIGQTLEQVERLAAEHGWEIASRDRSRETKSRYLTLERGDQRLVVRVSDHGSMYCREDISLAKDGGPDDHTLDDLMRRLV